MQYALIFLLPLTLLLVHIVGCLRLRHAPTRKAAYARLAAFRSALLSKLPTLGLGRPDVYVTDRFAAHRLLVRGAAAGGAFSDCPPSIVPSAVLSRRRHYNINSAPYGPLWRAVCRNLTVKILHPSRLRRYARRRALGDLVADLDRQRSSGSGGVVLAAESLGEAMFGLLAAMCFGGGVDVLARRRCASPASMCSDVLA
ncbi:cytochrome P450 89A9-like [Panicum virgatum]|uniref:cytochrome P450 89A9-like n=1 Tax=Panicum virgatum TaxID=38727 RepID=UPI0019D63753|nr:cytochrome P450 89A9-like [Panicum virgatum]